jgi:hypothetical protein
MAEEISAAARDYGALARAAHAGSQAAYREAAARVTSDEARIRATAGHL